MFPLKAKGVTVRGVERLDGDEGFAEIFLDGVFVPDSDVIGEVNQGWKVAMATTGSERGLTLRSPGRFMASAAQLIGLYRKERARLDATIARDVAQAYMQAEAYRWFTFQSVARMQAGDSVGADSSLNKVFWSEMDLSMHETALAILGEKSALDEGAPSAIDDGEWMRAFEFSLAGPIYAGTNEIQRNIIAERVLGLPKK
jgi:alkylation response protein AidB-like acyl-CoA dehydrogenase